MVVVVRVVIRLGHTKFGMMTKTLAQPAFLSGFLTQPHACSVVGFIQNLYTVTGDSLRSLEIHGNGSLVEVQEMKDGVQDASGQPIQYFSGLTALTVSPDGNNVYAVGTSVMPAVGGEEE